MVESLPLRPMGNASGWFSADLVLPDGAELRESANPRIYLAPLDSAVDARIVSASLKTAGLRPPRWIASGRGKVEEQRLFDAFLAGEPVLLPLAAPQSGPDRLARLLRAARRIDRDVELVPIEALWGRPNVRPSLWRVALGNPFDPPAWRRWLRWKGRENVRVIVGRPGALRSLAAQAPRADDALALSSFVRNQAVKALSVTERQVLGEQYKVPRLLVEQILAEPEFADRVAAAGATAGLTREEALRQAERALRTLYTTHDFRYMELFRRFCHWLYTRVYREEIVRDPEVLARLRALGQKKALIFIPSHKSNFDHLTLYAFLFEEGFPPPHTAAGENMAFFPMGQVLPRTGAYFIRRSFQDDPVYKEALAGFINYLVQRRFHQEFFIEGGRTRSGKLLPPRYGMLRYIVEGARRSGVQDVCFVPTSITYDQLLEVEEYARQAAGEKKQREDFRFLVRMIRSLRGRDFGRIYMRFGEPIDLGSYLERSGSDRLVVEKLAFRISSEINAETTLTPVALVCSALTGAGRALTLPELEHQVQRALEYAEARGIPMAEELVQGAKVTVEAGVRAMRDAGVIDLYDSGFESVYTISDKQHMIASYYRNTVIHFFLPAAIAMLAQATAQESSPDTRSWALRLREILKFEFFFSERARFESEIDEELARLDTSDPIGAASPGILLDYLESYWVVTETLRLLPPGEIAVSEADLLKRCHALGRQKLLQAQVHAPPLLSNLNFTNALRLAANQNAVITTDDGYRRGDAAALDALANDLAALAASARRCR